VLGRPLGLLKIANMYMFEANASRNFAAGARASQECSKRFPQAPKKFSRGAKRAQIELQELRRLR